MSTITLMTRIPSSVSRGLRPSSIGNSVPSLRSPQSSRPEPGRIEGFMKMLAVGEMSLAKPFWDQHLNHLPGQLVTLESE